MNVKKSICLIIILVFSIAIVNGQYEEFIYGDSVRQYAVYEPDLEPNAQGYPLVVALHGASAEGYSMIGTAFLAQKAAIEKFIVAAPNALHHPLITWWNAGGGYEAKTNGTDDVGFISAVIDTMIKNYNVDTTRIYLLAHSNGSMMAYRVASEMSHRIAAIATNSGQMVYEYCDPELPVPIIHFHGLEDPLCDYEGGGWEQINIPAVDSVMAQWREINRCSPETDTIYNENGIVGRKWESVDGNGDIHLYTIEGWGHSWPRTVEPGIDATDVMWDFLIDQKKGAKAMLVENEIVFDEEDHDYLLFKPGTEPGPDGYPLVIGLHCHTGTAQGLLTYTSLIKKANEENFIGVFPNGLKHAIGTAWNAGSSFEWMTGETDDVGFISALIDTIIKNYPVDTSRIYATGHSNGSMMSYRLAAELSHRIAAIGCVAAPMVLEDCDPEYSVPIIHFHGLSDTTCPYQGIVKDYITIPHVDSCLAKWKEINECDPNPEILIEESGIHGKKWTGSDVNSDIVLYTIDDCKHDWPTFDNYGISATDEIWNFFETHKKTIETMADKLTRPSGNDYFQLYQNYPNPFISSTNIKYNLFKSGNVLFKIYNLIGQEIKTLVDQFQAEGEYSIRWQPEKLTGGIYFYQLEVSGKSEKKKLIIID